LSVPEILQLVRKLDDEARAIKKDALKSCWYMRGMSYAEAMHLSFEERDRINEIISENLQTTQKTGLSFF
jgi:hypothetical protein